MMKRRRNLTLITLSVMLLAVSSGGCGQGRSATESEPKASSVTARERTTKMKIRIGKNVFDATLFDSPTADAFKAMLPLTLLMDELNGNEKKYDFSKALPTQVSSPITISSGDLMIWGDRTLVLFYKSFPTSYSYTKLGKIDDSSGLEAAVGKGDVAVTFELDGSTKE